MSRLHVFFRTWGGIVAASAAGAAMIGAALGLVAVVAILGRQAEATVLLVPPFAVLLAGCAGVVFGTVIGFVAAIVGAVLLVPYPGRWRVKTFSRAVGLVAGLLVDVLPAEAMIREWDNALAVVPAVLLLLVPPGIGLLLGTHLMDWYIAESEAPRRVRFA